MTRPKLKRWVCPTCGSGANAPGRPRKDDVRRYCLKCSERTGRLVQRTCPSMEAARLRKAQARKDTRARRREREGREATEQHVVDGLDVRAEWKRLLALKRVREWRRERGLRYGCPITVRWSVTKDWTTGHALTGYAYKAPVHLGFYVGCPRHEAEALMAHELAHAICEPKEHHGEVFRRRLALIVQDAYGIPVEAIEPMKGDIATLDGRIEKLLRERSGSRHVTSRERYALSTVKDPDERKALDD